MHKCNEFPKFRGTYTKIEHKYKLGALSVINASILVVTNVPFWQWRLIIVKEDHGVGKGNF